MTALLEYIDLEKWRGLAPSKKGGGGFGPLSPPPPPSPAHHPCATPMFGGHLQTDFGTLNVIVKLKAMMLFRPSKDDY